MRREAVGLVVAVVAAAGAYCGGGARTVPVRIPPVPKVAPVPSASGDPELCRVEIVRSPPPGAIRVGEADVPSVAGRDVVLDSGARSTACGLGATHAVREQAYVNRDGEVRQSLGLYRIDPAPGEPEAPDAIFPRTLAPGPIAPARPDMPDPNQQLPRPPPRR